MHYFIGGRTRVKMQIMAVRWVCKHSDCYLSHMIGLPKAIAHKYTITIDYVILEKKSIVPRFTILGS
jgi:hypothetical protein